MSRQTSESLQAVYETSLCVRVSSWTGVQQQTLGLFLKGDLILAVNDLHAVNLDEFNMFVSKSLKDKVRTRSDSGDAAICMQPTRMQI